MTAAVADATARPFPYRLAAIDIDDTLVGPDKLISAENRAAVARLRASGCRVVLASGREDSSMRLFYDALELDDYIVSSQGALVVHPRTGHELWYCPLQGELALHFVDEGRRRGADVLLYTRDGIFAAVDSPWLAPGRRAADTTLRFQPADLRALAAASPLKVLWYGHADQVAAWSRTMIVDYAARAEVVVTAPELLEFNAPNATKATAIDAIARHYAIDRAQVLAFGDGHNDVALLSWAGCGVAVGHGTAAALAAADLVIADGDVSTSLARGIVALLEAGDGASAEMKRPGALHAGP